MIRVKKEVLLVAEIKEALGDYTGVTIFKDLMVYPPDYPFSEAMVRLAAALNEAEERAGGARRIMRISVIDDRLVLFIGTGNWTRREFFTALGEWESFSCMDGLADPEALAEQLRISYRLEI